MGTEQIQDTIIENHSCTPVPPEHSVARINPELLEYIKNYPEEIRPLQCLRRDPLLQSSLTGACISATLIPSALTDDNAGGVNPVRLSAGCIGVTYMLLQFGVQLAGRYQTYRDLADLQKGVTHKEIISRARMQDMSWHKRAGSYLAHKSVEIGSFSALFSGSLVIASGLIYDRPGEAVTSALRMPGILARLLPQNDPLKAVFNFTSRIKGKTYGTIKKFLSDHNETPEGTELSRPSDAPPSRLLRMSAMQLSGLWNLAVVRAPLLVNAAYAQDPYSGFWGVGGMAQDLLIAKSDKRAIGRYGGSILTAENGHEIARNLLEGIPVLPPEQEEVASPSPAN